MPDIISFSSFWYRVVMNFWVCSKWAIKKRFGTILEGTEFPTFILDVQWNFSEMDLEGEGDNSMWIPLLNIETESDHPTAHTRLPQPPHTAHMQSICIPWPPWPPPSTFNSPIAILHDHAVVPKHILPHITSPPPCIHGHSQSPHSSPMQPHLITTHSHNPHNSPMQPTVHPCTPYPHTLTHMHPTNLTTHPWPPRLIQSHPM